MENTDDLKDFVVSCLEEKKAENIVVLDIQNKTQLAKYMIFASGRSTKNVGAIAEYIALEAKQKLRIKANLEGVNNSEWVLLDFGDIILHIFCPETRDHFNLESMWKKD